MKLLLIMKQVILLVVFITSFSQINGQDSLMQYTGKYEFKGRSVLSEATVIQKNDKLILTTAMGNAPMTRVKDDAYSIPAYNAKIFFTRNEENEVAYIKIEFNNILLEGKKTSKLNSTNEESKLTREQLISDLKMYEDSFPAKHINFNYLKRDEFSKLIENIRSKKDLDITSFTVELLNINAKLQDDHSGIVSAPSLIFPFNVEALDDAIVIVKADSLNQKYLGYKIVEIDNKTIDEIKKAFCTIIKQNNKGFFEDMLSKYLNKPSIMFGLKLITSTQYGRFTLVSPQGDTIKTQINSIDLGKDECKLIDIKRINMLAYQDSKNYWFKMDTLNNIFYFNYMMCFLMQEESFVEFNSRLWRAVRENKPKKIILDLRFNGGGSSVIFKPFIDSIAASNYNKKGKFFVLIGKKTFSSALLNAYEAKAKTKSILIGQETGGNVNGFGEVIGFTLPNSKLFIRCSTKYFELNKKYKAGLKPDVYVQETYSDFINSYDRALETAINY